MKIKHILPLLFLTLGATSAHATFPVRRTIVHQQPDGTSVTINALGNGRYTLYTTTNGVAVLPGEDGHFYYARRNGKVLAPSNLLVDGKNQVSTTRMPQQLVSATEASALMEEACPQQPLLRIDNEGLHTQSLTTSTEDGLGKYGTSAQGAVQSIGKPVLPVVMVNFADRKFREDHDAKKISRFFNESGYKDEAGSKGSVRDYFLAQSDSLFAPQFEVVAQVTLPNGYAYYGKDSQSGTTDPNSITFVKDVLAEAEKQVDFSKYCLEGTSKVPMVALMFAGPGQQSSFEDGNSDYLWAKFQQSSFSVNNKTVTIGSYFMGNELLQQYGSSPNDIKGAELDGVGLFCHEFGHALGLPDFYNTSKSSGSFTTMGYWDIMDYGQYFYDGYRPMEYTAYERSYMGWLPVEELTDVAQFVRVLPLDGSVKNREGARAYVVRNPENKKEYYIFSAPHTNKWHASMMGEGLFVLHVDYERANWNGNSVNTKADRQRMTYVPADNVKEGSGSGLGLKISELFKRISADLFPLQNDTININSLTDDTTPATILNTGSTKKLSRPIYNIERHEDGSVTFSYLDATLTGINQVLTPAQASKTNTTIYDVLGRRIPSLQQAAPGIYIVGGRKVVKK